MQGLFDPVVKDILKLVSDQAELAKKTRGRTIDVSRSNNRLVRPKEDYVLTMTQRCILVGGFGDSDYLNEKLRKWCTRNGNIQLTCPPDWY